MSGYMFLEMKQIKKSLAFFTLAVKYYPKSANAFDSLAEFYASQKDFAKAVENETKAHDISKSAAHLKKITEYTSNLKDK